jgi:hypothetical protein
VQAVKRVSALDRREVRRAFERRFTARRMAEDYLRHYRQVLDGRDNEVPRGKPGTLARPLY